MQYRDVINSIALDQLTPDLFKPDPQLGIGEEEDRASLPILIQKNAHAPAQAIIVPSANTSAYELASVNMVQVSEGELMTDFFVGSPIEGV